MIRPRILALIAAVLTAACATKDGAGDSSSAQTSAASPASAGAATMPDNPTSEDISNYPLDMDKMRKLQATMKSLEAAARANPGSISSGSNSETAAQTIARIESNPTERRAIENAGWTVGDFVWTTAAMLQASMMEGTLAATPSAKLPAGHNPRNLEFMKAHKAELEAMAQ
jgi:predicted small secreted protein